MVLKESAEAVTATVNAMAGSPMTLGLLLVNLAFLAFAVFVLGAVATNAQERNKNQMELIGSLVHEIKQCYDKPRG